MSWVYLIIAGMLEIVFAVSLKLMDGHKNLLWSALFYISMVLSFVFLSFAMRSIPVGTAYAIWTGIGTAGVAAVGICFLGEPFAIARVACLVLLVVSIIGLKLAS
ncbi:MAG: DMT family transporter [Candidatus Lariskella arthropodorum]|uniref:DMT family transporter n=1 Tax=Candidatus Lariskella endosymbiont of Epinotia ramella TaxID=3066224 RepID=UPI0030D19341